VTQNIKDRVVVITGATATKHAVRVISEGLRQEVKAYNIRTTVISPGSVATELPNSTTDPATWRRESARPTRSPSRLSPSPIW
jgi:NADP-dependent 3-hydroxy acid dehydrogenase YdfG